MILPIRYYGDPVLRKVASPVAAFDEALEQLARDMVETTYGAEGVGLAAPQVGVSKRIFVALEMPPSDDEDLPEDYAELDAAEKRALRPALNEYVMVNPEIVGREGVQYGQDGCLSVPGLYVEALRRDHKVVVRYQDLKGEAHTLEAEGRFAHVLQHELDHLDGIFYFDRLEGEDKRRFLEEHRHELAELQRQAKSYLKQLKTEPEALRAR